jgi:hypothetical protein
MPVPDPNSATDRWSVDLLLADQDAIPTFVECKRFADTRARREVVGQVLEYAANGHYYWSKEDLRARAERTAKKREEDLEKTWGLLGACDEGVDAYFEHMQQNLREGQVRLVFFMDHSPMELRSLVDFLNKQMERSEVLLVEAQQFRDGERVIIAPMLFGYTEEARTVKRTVTVSSPGSRRQWDEESFFEDAERHLNDDEKMAAIRQLYRFAQTEASKISPTAGAKNGFRPQWPATNGTLFTAYSDGSIQISFGNLDNKPNLQQQFRDELEDALDVPIPDGVQNTWHTLKICEWMPHAAEFIDIIRRIGLVTRE